MGFVFKFGSNWTNFDVSTREEMKNMRPKILPAGHDNACVNANVAMGTRPVDSGFWLDGQSALVNQRSLINQLQTAGISLHSRAVLRGPKNNDVPSTTDQKIAIGSGLSGHLTIWFEILVGNVSRFVS